MSVKQTVYEDKYFQVISPALPLNCRDDGGHLILLKKEKVTDRSELTYQEAIDFMRISMAVGRAMYDVLGIERMNYEDLGNWGIDEGHLKPFTDADVTRLRARVAEILGESKYLKMAELAEL
jgi:diadenosine tetraphosphate (Ap4A) HIT family hydrolase